MRILAAFLGAFGIAVLLFGVVTEYRQSRDPRISLVATIPHAVGAAMLLTLAAVVARLDIRPWAYPTIFVGALALGLVAIRAVRRRRT